MRFINFTNLLSHIKNKDESCIKQKGYGFTIWRNTESNNYA